MFGAKDKKEKIYLSNNKIGNNNNNNFVIIININNI